MTDDEIREQRVRVNKNDKEAIEEYRDKYHDSSTALGYAIRAACKRALEDDDSGGVVL